MAVVVSVLVLMIGSSEGDECVAQGMTKDDDFFRQPFGPGRPNIIGLQHLEHVVLVRGREPPTVRPMTRDAQRGVDQLTADHRLGQHSVAQPQFLESRALDKYRDQPRARLFGEMSGALRKPDRRSARRVSRLIRTTSGAAV